MIVPARRGAFPDQAGGCLQYDRPMADDLYAFQSSTSQPGFLQYPASPTTVPEGGARARTYPIDITEISEPSTKNDAQIAASTLRL
jgi:hypothetical protein